MKNHIPGRTNIGPAGAIGTSDCRFIGYWTVRLAKSLRIAPAGGWNAAACLVHLRVAGGPNFGFLIGRQRIRLIKLCRMRRFCRLETYEVSMVERFRAC